MPSPSPAKAPLEAPGFGVAFSRQGAVGVVTLDRPEAINALTLPMVAAIAQTLGAWAGDQSVRAVLLEGRGAKGFCAGGDVRAVREAVLSGDADGAMAFFAAEYALNRQIATYPKPLIALQIGIVMGGGIGLSSHARFRIATQSARFAMPEGAIGFFADVGVNALLAQAPRAPALAFLLTGATVEASDAVSLGLSDLVIADGDVSEARRRVIEAANAESIDTAIGSLLQSMSIVSGDAPFCRLAESLSDCFEDGNADEIVAMLELAAEDGDVGAATLAAKLRENCPTTVAVNLAAHLKARRARSLEKVLATDLSLARIMIARDDFLEGVRARLIDKSGTPPWSPDRLHLVARDEIGRWLG